MSGSLATPHDGQTNTSAAAQPPQNLRPGRFSVPQFEQIIRRSDVTGQPRAYSTSPAGTAPRAAHD